MNLDTKSILLALGISVAALLPACEEYNAPPEPTLRQPEGGAFEPGDSLFIEFSESIDPDSLEFNIWGDDRNIELEIRDDAVPYVKSCHVDEDCGDVTTVLSSDGKTARIDFNPDTLGAAGPPLILDIKPGLADKDGNDTGIHKYNDFQFRGGDRYNANPVDFQQGVYILVGSVKEPLPAILTIIADIKTLDDGTFVMAGAEGDPVSSEFADNTANPEELMVDEGTLGWTVHVTGFVKDDDGVRRLETDPTLVQLPLGPLTLKLLDLRLFGEVVKNEDGNDRIEGTLSFSEIILDNNGRETHYDAGAAAVSGNWIKPSLIPAGHPVLCEDPCGAVVEGFCEPPTPWPPVGFCDAYAAENAAE